MQASFFRAVFVAILVTTVTGVKAQPALVLKSATFIIPFKMQYRIFDQRNGIDTILHNLDSVWKYEYNHKDTLFRISNVQKLGVDSFLYDWSSEIIPANMRIYYKLEKQAKLFSSLTYHFRYAHTDYFTPQPYPGEGTIYHEFNISLSSLQYSVQDTILTIDVKGNEFLTRLFSTSLTDGYEEVWQGKFSYAEGDKWYSVGVDVSAMEPSCHLEFIVPKDFQSSISTKISETDKHFTARVLPASREVELLFPALSENSILRIYDVLGGLVYSSVLNPGEHGQRITPSVFKTGVYFANLNGKFVKFSITK